MVKVYFIAGLISIFIAAVGFFWFGLTGAAICAACEYFEQKDKVDE